MTTIRYRFADGHFEEIEVTEEFKRQYEFLLVQERARHWKIKKQKERAGLKVQRDVSLELLVEKGCEIQSNKPDPLVDEESLEYIVKENATDLSRLRCFIGKTYDDDIYKFDGYGNLQNVDISDFEGLIDDIVSDLKCEITILICEEACL